MSNFQCPHCGMTNIDCGKDGYKTPKEIDLEKDNEDLQQQIDNLLAYRWNEVGVLERKLEKIKEIATEACNDSMCHNDCEICSDGRIIRIIEEK